MKKIILFLNLYIILCNIAKCQNTSEYNKSRIKYYVYTSYSLNSFSRISLKNDAFNSNSKFNYKCGHGNYLELGIKMLALNRVLIGISLLKSSGIYFVENKSIYGNLIESKIGYVNNAGASFHLGVRFPVNRFFIDFISGIEFAGSVRSKYDRQNKSFVQDSLFVHGPFGYYRTYTTSSSFINLNNSIKVGYFVLPRLEFNLKLNYNINLNSATIEFDDFSVNDRLNYNFYWLGGGFEVALKISK